MQGGVSDEVTLSAYITASFLEMNSSLSVSHLFQLPGGDMPHTVQYANLHLNP